MNTRKHKVDQETEFLARRTFLKQLAAASAAGLKIAKSSIKNCSISHRRATA